MSAVEAPNGDEKKRCENEEVGSGTVEPLEDVEGAKPLLIRQATLGMFPVLEGKCETSERPQSAVSPPHSDSGIKRAHSLMAPKSSSTSEVLLRHETSDLQPVISIDETIFADEPAKQRSKTMSGGVAHVDDEEEEEDEDENHDDIEDDGNSATSAAEQSKRRKIDVRDRIEASTLSRSDSFKEAAEASWRVF